MNVVAIARRGIGIAGPPPVGLAIGRGIAIDLVRHAEPRLVTIQVAAGDAERVWLARLGAPIREAPAPPGIVFALRVANGPVVVGSILVAEHEPHLGHRLGAVIRIGTDSIELDRRDGSPPTPVEPAFVGLSSAVEFARGSPAGV